MGISYRNLKKLALDVGLFQAKTKEAAEYAAAEEKVKCMVEEVVGEVGKSDEGSSEVNM